jgi:hypothetical protein
MSQRLLLIADSALPETVLVGCRDCAASLADFAGEPVVVAFAGKARLRAVRAALLTAGGAQHVETVAPAPPRSVPMGSAPFVWREDGRPDWAEMWTTFCDLALYGGPPHRGDDSALHAPDPERATTAQPVEQPWEGYDPIAEIRRGIWETTGLFAEPADEPGWIVVTCESRKMAAWLCATIILENVDARCEDERLFLPASRDFHLKDEVKSVITVLAKTHHYWQAHIAAQAAAGAPAGG